ncbi:hypothetical protein HPB49_024169 [Dermacentor silvarum]|uniref:Uncharacterized protein n=1 Tax=Dermacentor silvarum TaxID=543639 RepID=A0ACB8DL96_DERSI|nr:hypothetical protein HPB49_024169 [Dermacentor silvarum]
MVIHTRARTAKLSKTSDDSPRYLPYRRPGAPSPPAASIGACRRARSGSNGSSAMTTPDLTPGQRQPSDPESNRECKRYKATETDDESTLIDDCDIADITDLDDEGFRLVRHRKERTVGIPVIITPVTEGADLKKSRRTSTVVLTFAPNTDRPEKINLGFTRHETTDYVETPPRCFKCQRYGHVAKYCRGDQRLRRPVRVEPRTRGKSYSSVDSSGTPSVPEQREGLVKLYMSFYYARRRRSPRSCIVRANPLPSGSSDSRGAPMSIVVRVGSPPRALCTPRNLFGRPGIERARSSSLVRAPPNEGVQASRGAPSRAWIQFESGVCLLPPLCEMGRGSASCREGLQIADETRRDGAWPENEWTQLEEDAEHVGKRSLGQSGRLGDELKLRSGDPLGELTFAESSSQGWLSVQGRHRFFMHQSALTCAFLLVCAVLFEKTMAHALSSTRWLNPSFSTVHARQ